MKECVADLRMRQINCSQASGRKNQKSPPSWFAVSQLRPVWPEVMPLSKPCSRRDVNGGFIVLLTLAATAADSCFLFVLLDAVSRSECRCVRTLTNKWMEPMSAPSMQTWAHRHMDKKKKEGKKESERASALQSC